MGKRPVPVVMGTKKPAKSACVFAGLGVRGINTTDQSSTSSFFWAALAAADRAFLFWLT